MRKKNLLLNNWKKGEKNEKIKEYELHLYKIAMASNKKNCDKSAFLTFSAIIELVRELVISTQNKFHHDTWQFILPTRKW